LRQSLRWALSAVLLTTAAPLFAQQDLDSVVERVRREFNVPGIAVGIVKDGKPVFAKGYGVRQLGSAEPVTPRTLFGIASNTKAFTSAALAILVDEGKLKWDDRVVDRLPGFQMSDAYVTREMRIRDLLCHRSGLGLGAGDLMFFPASNLSEDEILYRLRFVPLSTSFRSAYAYDNILYNVAGAVVRQVSGKTWARFIEERFFAPLGMSGSKTSITAVGPNEDVISPHALEDGKLRAVKATQLDNNAPAGAIVSSVEDMSKWVIALLNQGDRGAGKRLFSQRQARELWAPATILPIGDYPPMLAALKPHFSSYALGETLRDYRGHLIVSHNGGLQGVVTKVTMLPELKLGIIVLTNQEEDAALDAINWTIVDEYLNAPKTDWVAAFVENKKHEQESAAKALAAAASQRDTRSKPSLPLEAYAGRYRDPWYGDVEIEKRGASLAIRFTHSQALTGKLEHWQYDTFIARWNNRTLLADAYATFVLNPDGSVAQVKMKAVSPLTDFSFDFHDLVLTRVSQDVPAWD
jgi:CubicO group peptidase (beta-lactamase class C family)